MALNIQIKKIDSFVNWLADWTRLDLPYIGFFFVCFFTLCRFMILTD